MQSEANQQSALTKSKSWTVFLDESICAMHSIPCPDTACPIASGFRQGFGLASQHRRFSHGSQS
ncbi:hypothetical protein AGR6A_pAt60227 [Agrobacterium sp. NCPPB 925]|nr:hypothetical protein AGR6A_pAt60227 [Agrobacterium sp. NCPPB 925]